MIRDRRSNFPRDFRTTRSVRFFDEAEGEDRFVSRNIPESMRPVLHELRALGYHCWAQAGEGGTGTVFRATDRIDRRVLIKALDPRTWGLQISRQRFLFEAGIAYDLDHPNIVRTTDYVLTPRATFIVMEDEGGESLDKILRPRCPMFFRRSMEIVKDVAEGLDFIWKRGIIHGDIKPGNIIITKGRSQICDFSSCRVLDPCFGFAREWPVLGTPPYSPPEHAKGNTGLDWRFDIYSLGIVWRRLATGRLPFKRRPDGGFDRVPVPPLHEVNPAVSKGISDLVDLMMSPDPLERPMPAEVVDKISANLSSSQVIDPYIGSGFMLLGLSKNSLN